MSTIIYQESEHGCGLAVLRMVLCDLQKQSNYQYLTLDGHPPYSLKQLEERASKEGVLLSFMRAENAEAIMDAKEFPMILSLKGREGSHLVYCPKATKRKVLLYDPALGPRWVKREELKEEWDLVFGKVELLSHEKCPYQAPKLFSWTQRLVPSLLSVFACVALFAGFYFVRDDGNYLVSILLFALYGILEIISRRFLFHAMKQCDERWLKRVAVGPKEQWRERYLQYSEWKKNAFPGVFALFSSLTISIALTILIGWNSPYFFVSVAGMLVYLLAKSIGIGTSIEQAKRKIETSEHEIFSTDISAEEATRGFEALNEEGYHIGSELSYERILFVAMALALALLPLLSAESITLNYYLFHFAGLLAIGVGLRQWSQYWEEAPVREQNERYFLEYFVKDEESDGQNKTSPDGM